MDSNEFTRILAGWADQEHALAQEANESQDERSHSIYLMKESMYRNMLTTLGIKAPDKLARIALEMSVRAELFKADGDMDNADRCMIQRACAERVIALLRERGKIK